MELMQFLLWVVLQSNPYTSNVLDYVTIQTTGNATDFGDSAAQAEKGGAVAGAAS